jgi:hypothetical protein
LILDRHRPPLNLGRLMPSQLACPHCGNVLRTTSTLGPGQRVRCPKCHEAFSATAEGTAPGPRPARSGGSWLGVLLSLIALLLVVGLIVLLAAYVWPGFMRLPAPAPAIDDPMSVLPADSNWVIGADLERLRGRQVLEPILALLVSPPPGVPVEGMPQSLVNLLRDGDRVLIAGSAPDDPPRMTVAMVTKDPVNIERFKQELKASPSRTLRGFVLYRVEIRNSEADPKGTLGWLAVPGKHLAVVSTLDEVRFAALLADAERHPAHPAQDLIQEAQADPLWAVLRFDDRMKKALKKTLPGELAQSPALQDARGALVRVDFPEKPESLQAKLDVLCASDADAGALADAGNKYWKVQKAKLAAIQLGLMFINPPLARVLEEFGRNVTIYAEADRARVTVQLMKKTLDQVQKAPK